MESKSETRVVSFFLCYFVILFIGFLCCLALKSEAASVAPKTCKNGTISECNEEDDEMVMDSEINTRLMMETKKFISPGALKRDKPVCNGGGRGAAYSKSGGCLPPPSNRPTRGCSKYYRCRSDS